MAGKPSPGVLGLDQGGLEEDPGGRDLAADAVVLAQLVESGCGDELELVDEGDVEGVAEGKAGGSAGLVVPCVAVGDGEDAEGLCVDEGGRDEAGLEVGLDALHFEFCGGVCEGVEEV